MMNDHWMININDVTGYMYGCIQLYKHLYVSTCVCVHAPVCVWQQNRRQMRHVVEALLLYGLLRKWDCARASSYPANHNALLRCETELMSTNTHGHTHKHANTHIHSIFQKQRQISLSLCHTHTHPADSCQSMPFAVPAHLTLSISDLFSFSTTPHCTSVPTTRSLSPFLQFCFNTLSHLFSTSYERHTLSLMKERNMK